MTTSVAMCTYNGEKFLHQQLDSILNQTQKIDEIVVCDDGSTDSTILILNNYKEKHPNIFKIHQNEKKLRSVKNFEKVISLCENKIIFLSDQDDIWLPEKVEKYLEFFKKNPNIDVLASNGFGIDENNNVLDVISIWDLPKLVKNSGESFDYFKILSRIENFATGASMALRKTYVKEIFPFPEIKDFHHDEWIALISSYNEKFEILDEKFFKYRIHSRQLVGGVFYKNTEKQKNKLINYFSVFKENKDFGTYKKLLKRLSEAHKKNILLKENVSIKHKKIFEDDTIAIEDLFWKTRKELSRNFPIKTKILDIWDKLKNKRKLYDGK